MSAIMNNRLACEHSREEETYLLWYPQHRLCPQNTWIRISHRGMGEGMLLCEMPVGSWVLLVDHLGGDLSCAPADYDAGQSKGRQTNSNKWPTRPANGTEIVVSSRQTMIEWLCWLILVEFTGSSVNDCRTADGERGLEVWGCADAWFDCAYDFLVVMLTITTQSNSKFARNPRTKLSSDVLTNDPGNYNSRIIYELE